MKKIVAMLLTGMMALSLAACGSSSSSASAPAADAGAKEEAQEAVQETEEAVQETEEAVQETEEAVQDAAQETEQTEEAPADSTFQASIAGTSAAAAAVPAGEVTTVSSGELHMATNASFPPYEMTDDKGGYEGIDVEIAGIIAERLGLTLVVDDMEFGSVITSVQSGKEDIAMAGLTVNEERKKNIDFTDSYATGVQVIIVPADSDIKSREDLSNNKMIGCQQGTTGSIYCGEEYGEDHVTDYTNGAMAIEALKAGKVDAVVIDNEPAKQFVANNEGLTILETEYTVENYAIGVSKENPVLRDAINSVLNDLIADGTVKTVLDKYINAGE